MCEYCNDIKEIKEEDERKKNPLETDTVKFSHREKLVLAKIGNKVLFYGFNKYAYEDDAIYKNIECAFCPKCGRNLTDVSE